MKHKISNILKTLFAFTLLVTVVSCSDINSPDKKASDKPVLRIVLPQDARTVVPDCDFKNFSFTLKNGETVLGTYNSSTALTKDIIDLTAKGIKVGAEVTLSLAAQKDEISWAGSTTTTITAGENIVQIKLFVKTLGTGNGSIAYTLDFSASETKKDVVSAHVVIRPAIDADANPIVDEWYGLDADGNAAAKSIGSDGKVVIKKSNVPVGSYNLTAELFAEARPTSKIIDWGENIVVAANTTSDGTAELKNLNEVYTVTFNPNYSGGQAYQRKLTNLTSLESFVPKRKGYLFRDWYTDQACTDSKKITNWYNYNPSKEDITVYAKWEAFAPGAQTVSIFDSETLYVTPENYTISNLDWFDERTAWYIINTVPGTQYKIRWIAYNNCGATNYIYDGIVLDPWSSSTGSSYPYKYFGTYEISLYSDDATPLVLNNKNGSEITSPSSGTGASQIIFTAESEETYIKVEMYNSTSNKVGAFRVMNYDPDEEEEDSLFAVVKVGIDEIGVSFKRAGTTQTLSGWSYVYLGPYQYSFSVAHADDYESFAWYVNGKLVSTSSSFSLACKNYAVGVYTVTLEAVKESNNEYYSYNAQVRVTELDKTQGA